MDTANRQISFIDALGRLQAMLGKTVSVQFNDYINDLGGGFEGRLDRVETLPPDNTAIVAAVGNGGGFHLDPSSVKTYLVGDAGSDSAWLEFQPRHGCTIVVKRPGPA